MLSVVQILIPFISAIFIVFVSKQFAKQIAFISSLITLVLTIVAYYSLSQNQIAALSIDIPWITLIGAHFHLSIDGISLVMLLIGNLLMPFILLSTWKDSIINNRLFFSLMLMMQGAMNGVFISFDLFLYYIFWELALIPALFLLLWWGSGETKRITIKFFIYTLFGSLFMLAAIIYISVQGGLHSTDIDAVYKAHLSESAQGIIFFAFMLAYAIKIPIFPFHTWQPETYTAAPTALTMLLSGVMLKMGLYSIIRWVIPVVPLGVENYNGIIIGLCAFGIFYASLIAWRQKNMKTLFAYASMAHVGLIAAGLLTATSIGLQGGILQMFAHAIYSFGLFYVCYLFYKSFGSYQFENFGGIRVSAPLFAGFFLIILLASISLPLTNAFPGEFLLFNVVYQFNPWLCLFAASGIILGAVYMLRTYKKAMLGNLNKTFVFNEIGPHEKIILIPIAILIFLFGLFPQFIMELTEKPVAEIIQLYQIQLDTILK